MDITIYGIGYVGKAVANFLKDHYQLQLVDALPGSLNDNEYKVYGISEIRPTKYAVICVPTKMNEDGSCDTSIVEEIIRKKNHEHYLIKSTVVPGTTDRLIKQTGNKNIVFSPEYIGEGKYEIPFWKDLPHPTNMKLHSFHIFGGNKKATAEWINVWQKISGWSASYHQTDTKTAEMVKYAENTFLATKKIFFDELYSACETVGIDYNELKELVMLDGRVGRSMSLIFPEQRGFDGKCLPKDVNAICKYLESVGYEPKFWREVLTSNKRFRDEAERNNPKL